MSGITGAIVVGGSALAGTVAGGLIAKSGAQAAGQSAADATVEAAKIQAASTDKSIAAQQQMTDKAANVLREQYGIARQDLLPFQQVQLKALQDAAGLTDPNSQIYQDERRLSTESIQRQLSAQGLLRSKNQVDLLSNLEVGLNSERFNRVNQLAGIGAAQQGAALSQGLGGSLSGLYGNLGQNIGSTFQNSGNTLAGLYQNLGQVRGQTALAGSQAIGGIVAGGSNALQGVFANVNAMNNQQAQLALLNKLMGGGGGLSGLNLGQMGASLGSSGIIGF